MPRKCSSTSKALPCSQTHGSVPATCQHTGVVSRQWLRPAGGTQCTGCSQVHRYSSKHLDFYIQTVDRGTTSKVVLFFISLYLHFEKLVVDGLCQPAQIALLPYRRCAQKSKGSSAAPSHVLTHLFQSCTDVQWGTVLTVFRMLSHGDKSKSASNEVPKGEIQG